MLFILCVRVTIKVKVGIPESFKVGWYPPKKTGSSHLKGGHLGFKSTEGAGIGACSGKGWGGGKHPSFY